MTGYFQASFIQTNTGIMPSKSIDVSLVSILLAHRSMTLTIDIRFGYRLTTYCGDIPI